MCENIVNGVVACRILSLPEFDLLNDGRWKASVPEASVAIDGDVAATSSFWTLNTSLEIEFEDSYRIYAIKLYVKNGTTFPTDIQVSILNGDPCPEDAVLTQANSKVYLCENFGNKIQLAPGANTADGKIVEIAILGYPFSGKDLYRRA